MADGDLNKQLGVEQQINAAIKARADLMAQNSDQLANQVQLAIDLCKSLKCEELDEVGERLKSMRGSLNQVAEGAEKVSKQTGGMQKGLKKNSDRLKDISKTSKPMLDPKRGFLIAGFVAMKNKVETTWMALKNLGKQLMSIYNLYSKVKDSIMALPYKIMDKLPDAARGAA